MPKCIDCENLKLDNLKLDKDVPFLVITEGKDEIDIEYFPLTPMIQKETKTTYPDSQAHKSLREHLPFWLCLALNKPLHRRWNINKERKCKHYKPKRRIVEDWLRRGL